MPDLRAAVDDLASAVLALPLQLSVGARAMIVTADMIKFIGDVIGAVVDSVSVEDLLVLLGGAIVIALVDWTFFGRKNK